jgi:hypothetical protein
MSSLATLGVLAGTVLDGAGAFGALAMVICKATSTSADLSLFA